MCSSLFRILFSIFLIQKFTYAESELYSRCETSDNLPGLCIKIRQCKSVMDLIDNGLIETNRPKVCNKIEQTVCCSIKSILASSNSEATTEATNIVTEASNAVESSTGKLEEKSFSIIQERISERKCREYGQKVFHTVKIAPSLIGGKPHEIKVDRCKHKYVSLIVGGTNAKPFEFPHQGLVGYGRRNSLKYHCGCTLISPRFVLTAAHCLQVPAKNKILTPTAVKLGSISRFEDDDKTIIVDVEETFEYDHYVQNINTVIGDIALIKLAEEVTINEFILPICLPTKQHEDDKAIATGFGKTEYGGVAENLMKVSLERFSHSECKDLWRNKTIDSNAMLCYGHRTQERDSCRGDSGGPLLVSNAHKVSCTYTQIGIVSFGLKQCGTIGFPGVYVNVYNYLDWIEGIVWKDDE